MDVMDDDVSDVTTLLSPSSPVLQLKECFHLSRDIFNDQQGNLLADKKRLGLMLGVKKRLVGRNAKIE